MTALVVALAATCVTLGLLLACALVGYSEVVEELRTRLDRAEAENEDLTNELRHQARGNHPAGRGLSDTPTFDTLATERHLAEVRRLPTRGDAG